MATGIVLFYYPQAEVTMSVTETVSNSWCTRIIHLCPDKAPYTQCTDLIKQMPGYHAWTSNQTVIANVFNVNASEQSPVSQGVGY